MSVRHIRSFWERLSAEAEKQGVGAVAKRHGVRARTLTWWRWKLKREGVSVVRRAPKLLRVVTKTGPVGGDRKTGVVELAVGAVRVRIEPGTDVQYVAALVQAFRRC